MNDNIRAGADIHAGDGGYSIGTQEKYEEFAKARNKSLGKMRIKELAEQADYYACEQYGVEKVPYSVLFNQKFAELIVQECLDQCYNRGMNDELYAGQLKAAAYIEEHFGVER